MKYLKLFRAIINAVYFFSVLSLVLSPILIILPISGVDAKYDIGGYTLAQGHWSFYLVLAISWLGYALFVRMLYLLNRAAHIISPIRIFDTQIAYLIHQSGVYCIAAALLTKVPAFAYQHLITPLFTNSKIGIGLSFGFGFDSLFVILSFGFFMLITSVALRQGIHLKSENELTI